jgi:hypothetical protein
MDRIPTQIEEIERKSLEELERLLKQLEIGLIDERQFYRCLETLYNCVSGCLTSEVLGELEKHLAESSEAVKRPRALRVKVSHDSSRIVACTRDENGFKAYSFQNGKELFLTTPETYHKTVDIVFKSISGIEL